MISTLDAHIALDTLRQCEQRLRDILVSAQNGEYTHHAFWQSVQGVLTELYLCDPERPLGEVAQQLPERAGIRSGMGSSATGPSDRMVQQADFEDKVFRTV